MKLGKTNKKANTKGKKEQGKKEFEPLPAGDYIVKLDKVDIENKDNYDCITVQWAVTSGNHEKRKIWDRFMFNHSNPKVAEISEEKLAKLFIAMGASEEDIEPLTLEEPKQLVAQLSLVAQETKVIAILNYREYKGKQYANVKKYLAM